MVKSNKKYMVPGYKPSSSSSVKQAPKHVVLRKPVPGRNPPNASYPKPIKKHVNKAPVKKPVVKKPPIEVLLKEPMYIFKHNPLITKDFVSPRLGWDETPNKYVKGGMLDGRLIESKRNDLAELLTRQSITSQVKHKGVEYALLEIIDLDYDFNRLSMDPKSLTRRPRDWMVKVLPDIKKHDKLFEVFRYFENWFKDCVNVIRIGTNYHPVVPLFGEHTSDFYTFVMDGKTRLRKYHELKVIKNTKASNKYMMVPSTLKQLTQVLRTGGYYFLMYYSYASGGSYRLLCGVPISSTTYETKK